MSADWKAGDRALCVMDCDRPGTIVGVGGLLERGTIYLVEAVDARPDVGGAIGLHLAGVPSLAIPGYECLGPAGWWHERFRKIVPACDHSEREQTELMPHHGFWDKPSRIISP